MFEVRQTNVYERLRTFYEFNFPCHLHIKSHNNMIKHILWTYAYVYMLWEPHALHQYICARSDNPQTENCIYVYHTHRWNFVVDF